MSRRTMDECDHCGKRVENHYAEAGWIHIEGAILRSHGRYDKKRGCYATDYLDGHSGARDYCNIGCFIGALDHKRLERETEDAARRDAEGAAKS